MTIPFYGDIMQFRLYLMVSYIYKCINVYIYIYKCIYIYIYTCLYIHTYDIKYIDIQSNISVYIPLNPYYGHGAYPSITSSLSRIHVPLECVVLMVTKQFDPEQHYFLEECMSIRGMNISLSIQGPDVYIPSRSRSHQRSHQYIPFYNYQNDK